VICERPGCGPDCVGFEFRREQDALRRVAMLVTRGASPEVMFKTVAAEVSKILDSDITLIGRYESDSTFTYLATVDDHPPVSGALHRLVLGGNNLVTKILRSGNSESITYDVATGPIAAYARELHIRSAIGTPIVVEGHIWGAMLAGWTRSEDVSPDALRRIAGITELMATTIANAVGRAALIESRARVVAASDESRRAVERDLHDGAQQRLVTIALKLRSHQQAALPDATRLIDEVASDIEEVLHELRELAHGLHPPMLAAGGLRPALRGLARRAPIPVRLDIQVDNRLPERIEVAAYYVVGEALTNVAKHAHASLAVVVVTATDEVLTVSVADDGVGGADPGRGSGLLGMRDRVEALGGTMSVTSPPEGTTVIANLPITQPTYPAAVSPAARSDRRRTHAAAGKRGFGV
jgi:signal transduction histidine kinase